MAEPFMTVTVDTSALTAALDALKRPGLDRAVAVALAATAQNAKVKAAGLIAKHSGLPSAVVKQAIDTEYVVPGAYETHIRASKRPIKLIEFPSTRQNNTGVASRAFGRPQTFRGGFITTIRSTGHRGAFVRTTAARLPIKEMYGPTIAGTFTTPDVAAVITSTTKERLGKNLQRAIRGELRRQKH